MDSARNLSILALGEFNGFHETALHSSVERFLPRLLRALSDLPDPSGALERFQRVVESYNARTILFDILNENQAFFELLLSITHSSVFITDIVVNDPSLLDWLVEVGGILHPIEVKGIRKELERINADKRSDESFTRSCLALKNREELRIGSRDITGLATTAETFSELTAAAEHIVKAAFKRAINAMSLSGDTGKRYAFSVISAGKLGAGMMDFGSDLDLIFVYKGNVGGKSAVETPEYSIRLAQHILSLITGGGGVHKVYDVDARLRPEGGSSVLAVSLDEYRKYLMKRASVWERLALVRARHVAGMAKLGSEIIETLNGFIYRAPFSPSEIEKIMDIRANMTANSKKRYPGIINIKSGCGGIADIDFIAQSYAAHYGAGIPAVRHRETPHILNALVSEKIVDRHDAATLKNAYFFLCDVEKALRIGSGRPVNIVSGSETETARISQLLGFKNTARFRKRLEDVLTLTRELYNRLMKELFQRTADEQK